MSSSRSKSPIPTEDDTKQYPQAATSASEDGNGSTPTESQIEESITENDPFVSIYTTREKWFIVGIISVAGMFSPLTANVYLPALPSLVSAFHKPVELINLSVTVYMIFQGVSPMFWGTLSDSRGRRPMFMLCLLILSLSCVGLALVPTNAYWLLMLLRCLQAAGSASTIALGAGVIGDITRPEERGGMYGVYCAGPQIGPSIGPVIGGAIDGKLGWRAIFWFMCIASALCLVFLVLFLPETLRSLVGDGSIPPRIYRPLLPLVGRKQGTSHHDTNQPRPKPKPWMNPLILLKEPDIVLLLLFNGISMGIFYSIATTTSTLFSETYTFLSITQIGYCYLAMGGSMAVGTIVSGKVMDLDYRRMKKKLLRSKTLGDADVEKLSAMQKDQAQGLSLDFPIEYARLRMTPILCFLMVGCCAAYGWCIERKVSLAAPLILQAVLGFVIIWVMNAVQTLLLDLMPTRGSSITACNNLIRCGMGAIMVSIIQPIINGIGVGWTFVLLAASGAIGSVMIYVAAKVGPRCRRRRMEKAG